MESQIKLAVKPLVIPNIKNDLEKLNEPCYEDFVSQSQCPDVGFDNTYYYNLHHETMDRLHDIVDAFVKKNDDYLMVIYTILAKKQSGGNLNSYEIMVNEMCLKELKKIQKTKLEQIERELCEKLLSIENNTKN
jgi:hypothetical protein